MMTTSIKYELKANYGLISNVGYRHDDLRHDDSLEKCSIKILLYPALFIKDEVRAL